MPADIGPFKTRGGRTMLDFIMAAAEAERKGGITLEEWTRIRREGTPEEIAEAAERMAAAGGYGNLE
jgi:hypothetical protein